MGEAFVVAKVEIGFGPVVGHVNFAVLVGAHGARIDVDVGVEFLEPHAQAAAFEEHPDRCARQTLTKRTDNAAGNER